MALVIPCPRIANAKCVEPAREPEALQHLRTGNQLYDQEAFEAALREFRQAYELCQSEMVFFSIANCEVAMGRPAEAAEDFDRFLRGAPQEETELRDVATGKLKSLATRLLMIELRGAPGEATVRIDGAPHEKRVQAVPLYLTPGTHALRVRRGAALPFEQTVSGAPGTRLFLDVGIAAASDSGRPKPDEGRTRLWRRWWFWSALAAVVAGGAIAGYALSRPDRPACVLPVMCP